MRTTVLGSLALLPSLSLADETVAGKWRADLGSNVTIMMTVTPDERWSSQTLKGNTVVEATEGTYQQNKNSATSGMLVFTTIKATTARQQRGFQEIARPVEDTAYELINNGHVMQMRYGSGFFVFHKQ